MHCEPLAFGAFWRRRTASSLHTLPAPVPDWPALACTVAHGSRCCTIGLSAMPAQGGSGPNTQNRRALCARPVPSKQKRTKTEGGPLFVTGAPSLSNYRQAPTDDADDDDDKRPPAAASPRRLGLLLAAPQQVFRQLATRTNNKTRQPHDRQPTTDDNDVRR
jgi:hypothetical protein